MDNKCEKLTTLRSLSMAKKKVDVKTKGCSNCARMKFVKEDDRCPKLLSCVVHAKPGQEFKHYIPA